MSAPSIPSLADELAARNFWINTVHAASTKILDILTFPEATRSSVLSAKKALDQAVKKWNADPSTGVRATAISASVKPLTDYCEEVDGRGTLLSSVRSLLACLGGEGGDKGGECIRQAVGDIITEWAALKAASLKIADWQSEISRSLALQSA